MAQDDDERIARVANEIEAYLVKRPDASDTIEGIMSWWLPRQRYEQELDRVTRALDLLVQRGVVKKHQNIARKTIYSGAKRSGGGE